jgi:hypothetical protein
MSVWENLAWVVGGAAVGTPISAAMGSLPEMRIQGGVSLTAAQENARERTDWRVGELLRDLFGTDRRARARSSSKGDSDVLLFYLAGVFTATYVYAQNAVTVSVILFWLSVLCLIVTTLVFGVLYLRKVFDGHATGWMLVGTVVYAAVGAVVAYWLVEPPLHAVLGGAQRAIAELGLGGLFPYVVPLLYQLVGAIAAFAVLLASIALCVANVSAVFIAVGAWASGLWQFLFWLTRWTTHVGVIIAMVILAAISLLLSSGLVTDWVYSIQDAVTPSA